MRGFTLLFYLFGAVGSAKAIELGYIPLNGDPVIAIIFVLAWPFSFLIWGTGYVLIKLCYVFAQIWELIL